MRGFPHLTQIPQPGLHYDSIVTIRSRDGNAPIHPLARPDAREDFCPLAMRGLRRCLQHEERNETAFDDWPAGRRLTSVDGRRSRTRGVRARAPRDVRIE